MRKNRYDNIGRWNAFFCILAGISGLWWLGGCGMNRHKASRQADEKVYNIIDRNWRDSFGAKANYRLNDPNTAADPNNIILTTLSKTGKLSLAHAIQLSIMASPEYQAAREQLYLTGLDQTAAEHLYEITPFVSGGSAYTNVSGGSAYTKANKAKKLGNSLENSTKSMGGDMANSVDALETSDSVERLSKGADDDADSAVGTIATGGVRQLLATGAMISTDLTFGYIDLLSGDATASTSLFQVAITQPLLRGAKRVVVLETLTQAQRNTLYEIRSFNRFRKTFYVSVVDDYYRLLKYSRQVYNASENLLKLKTIVQRMETLAKVGMIPQFDLERGRQNALKASDDYSQIRQIYEEALDLYKNRLLIPQNMAIDLDMNDWYELEKMGLSNISISEQQSLQVAMSSRLDLINVFDQVEDARRHIEITEDALGADLFLVGGVSWQREAANLDSEVVPTKPHDTQKPRQYSLGIGANLPLDRVAERNNYKRTLIALMQAQRVHQQLGNQVEMEVRKAWRDMNQAKNRMATQKQARDLAGKRLDDTLLLMQYGKASATDVLDPQRDYFVALDNYAAALSDFGIAKMKFLRDTEILWINPEGRYEQRIAMEQKQSDLQKQN